jgi:hypothetical protein
MLKMKHQLSACAFALAVAMTWGSFIAKADHRGDDRDDRHDEGARTVFVVAMENHNWTQPGTTTSPQQIFMNPAAPFINSLVNGTSGISGQVAYATTSAWRTTTIPTTPTARRTPSRPPINT